LLARVLSQAGLQPVLLDVATGLVDRLQEAGCYRVHLVGKGREVYEVSGYRALHASETSRVCQEVASCAFAATSVGGPHLEAAAAILAPGICQRPSPLNILLCENWPHAEQLLAERLRSLGVDRRLFSCIRCSVEPMTIPVRESLDLLQEGGQSLYVDATGWLGPQPTIDGVVFTANLDAFYARKLYTNNAGHAVLAYEGALAGCRLIPEALLVPSIRSHLVELLAVASALMTRHFGLPAAEVAAHVQSLLDVRYANRELGDTIQRVGRDPLRKLGPNERLIGLLRLLQAEGLPTLPVARTVGAALRYCDPGDPSSLELGRLIADAGVESVLQNICGLQPDEACYRECLEQYRLWESEAV
jgi:mannitol-1-phosphate 5-dehydrogenase